MISAAQLKRIIQDKQQARALAEARSHQAADEEKKHRLEAFRARHLTPEAIARLLERVRVAAEGEQTELLLGHFPSDWCTDSGRAINNGLDTWPATLSGIAGEFYDYWEKELRPGGFHLKCQILDYSGGMPGDVGIILSWR